MPQPELDRVVNEPMDRSPAIPLLSLVFGFGPVFFLLATAIAAWLLPAPWGGWAIVAGWLWGTAILLFLAGVVRGLSFAAPDGPQPRQIVLMMMIFVLGLAALATPSAIAFPLLATGYLLVGVTDPIAAHQDLAPAHFARLRPPQMTVAVIALIALAARALEASAVI
jgi:hypothetical protein